MKIVEQVEKLLVSAAALPDGTSAIFYAATLQTRLMSEADAVMVFKQARQDAIRLLPQFS
jgi:hypothetical protein